VRLLYTTILGKLLVVYLTPKFFCSTVNTGLWDVFDPQIHSSVLNVVFWSGTVCVTFYNVTIINQYVVRWKVFLKQKNCRSLESDRRKILSSEQAINYENIPRSAWSKKITSIFLNFTLKLYFNFYYFKYKPGFKNLSSYFQVHWHQIHRKDLIHFNPFIQIHGGP